MQFLNDKKYNGWEYYITYFFVALLLSWLVMEKSLAMTDLSIWIEDVLLREELCQIKRFDGILFLKKKWMCRRKTKLENADLYYVTWFKEIHKATIVNNINARFHEKKLIFGQLLTILQCLSIDYMIPNHQKSLQRSWFPVFTWCYSHFFVCRIKRTI